MDATVTISFILLITQCVRRVLFYVCRILVLDCIHLGSALLVDLVGFHIIDKGVHTKRSGGRRAQRWSSGVGRRLW